MYGIILVLTIALLGGVIALLGDRVGMKVGKKRLSIFGLRPKYTSMIITVVTGILIAGATLLLLTLVSNDVRTALFRMKFLQQELDVKAEKLNELEATTKSLQENKVALEVERERLLKEIQAYAGEASLLRENGNLGTTGRLIFLEGEILATGVVEAGSRIQTIQNQLESMVQTVNRLAVERGARLPGKTDEALEIAEAFSDLRTYAARLAAGQQPGVLRVVVERNTEVFAPLPVTFAYFPDQRVFKAEEVITETVVSPLDGQNELLDQIVDLLVVLKQTALEKGMRAQGQMLGEILSPEQVSAALAQIKESNKRMKLQIVATDDLWRVDDKLKIELRLKAQDS